MAFSPRFFLLQKEGFLVRSCLGSGLTALRAANLDEPGKFYAAFIQLCIGLERMMKTIIIIDYMVDHHLDAPDTRTMKNYGHDLVLLFESTRALATKRGLRYCDAIAKVSMEYRILQFLAKFATSSRYYNVDRLGGAAAAEDDDPLVEWKKLLLQIISLDVPQGRIRRIREDAATMASILGDCMFVTQHDLDNRPLQLDETLRLPNILAAGASYAVYRLFKILSPLKETLSDVADEAVQLNQREDGNVWHIPYMREFFDFICTNKAFTLRRKRWP
jgi:hypothetical protein